MSQPAVTVVIPAFNEEQRLPATLDALAARLATPGGQGWQVIVSDDGSRDGTRALVEERAAADPRFVLVRGRHQGKGAALAAGIRAARHEHVALVDADLPVPLSTLDDLSAAASAGAAVVLGSRRLAGSTVVRAQPWVRRVGGHAYLVMARALGFRSATDPQCGVKLLVRSPILPILDATVNPGFAFDIELITRARAAGLAVTEVPVRWTHVDGSSLHPLSDAVRTLRDLIALRRTLRTAERPG